MSTERTFFFRFSQSSALTWEPATDVLDLGEAILVRLEVAGVLAEDLSIELYGQDLWIRGRRREPEEKKHRVLHMEIYYGPFAKRIHLPCRIDVSCAEASLRQGYLEIALPKVETTEFLSTPILIFVRKE
jgi:HSP20 family protein